MPNIAKEIRKIISNMGYSSRKISVTEEQGGLSFCFNVVIKERTINKELIENAIKHLTKVERDERSGEVLSGGNTFIFVSYKA